MDQNPVAPFDMYADEVILWMEYCKGPYTKKYFKRMMFAFYATCFLAVISTIIAVLLRGNYIILNLMAFFSAIIAFALSVTTLRFWTYNKGIQKNAYYVTNYRVISFRNGKRPIVKYSYIADVESYKITNVNNGESGEKSIEFKLKIREEYSDLCYDFFNIDDADEVGGIIDEIKAEHENNFATYDFVVQ